MTTLAIAIGCSFLVRPEPWEFARCVALFVGGVACGYLAGVH